MSQQPHHQDGVWSARPTPEPQEADPLPAPPALPDLQGPGTASQMVIGRAAVPVRPGPAATVPPPGPAAAAVPAPASASASAPATAPVSASAPVAAPIGAGTAGPIARRIAAPAVTGTPLASASALAAADLIIGRPQDNPPSVDDEQTDAEARTGPSGRMARLHVGWHSLRRSSLASISVASSVSGLVIGHDRQQAAVPVRLFAPEPVRIALVGGVWAAQLLIFRAFALGARVTVITSEPAAWTGFGERATGQYDRLTVLADDQAVPLTGTAQQPMLAVYDLRESGPATAPALGPWRSQLTILRHLDRPGVPALQEAQLILLQRLGGEEAALAASALRLRNHSGTFLQFMADDMMALIADGTDRYLSLSQTRTEYDNVGPPRR